MDILKETFLWAGTLGAIFHFRTHLSPVPENPLSIFLLGIAAANFCVYILPLRYNPGNMFLAEFTRRRLKQQAKQAKNKKALGKLDRYERLDMYGLEHAFLNLDLEPRSMWENVGYWKVSFSPPCFFHAEEHNLISRY